MNVKGQITKGYKHRKVATHCKYGHEFTEENHIRAVFLGGLPS